MCFFKDFFFYFTKRCDFFNDLFTIIIYENSIFENKVDYGLAVLRSHLPDYNGTKFSKTGQKLCDLWLVK